MFLVLSVWESLDLYHCALSCFLPDPEGFSYVRLRVQLCSVALARSQLLPTILLRTRAPQTSAQTTEPHPAFWSSDFTPTHYLSRSLTLGRR